MRCLTLHVWGLLCAARVPRTVDCPRNSHNPYIPQAFFGECLFEAAGASGLLPPPPPSPHPTGPSAPSSPGPDRNGPSGPEPPSPLRSPQPPGLSYSQSPVSYGQAVSYDTLYGALLDSADPAGVVRAVAAGALNAVLRVRRRRSCHSSFVIISLLKAFAHYVRGSPARPQRRAEGPATAHPLRSQLLLLVTHAVELSHSVTPRCASSRQRNAPASLPPPPQAGAAPDADAASPSRRRAGAPPAAWHVLLRLGQLGLTRADVAALERLRAARAARVIQRHVSWAGLGMKCD